MELPFVSVIICTYNRGAVLAACLESVAHQTYPRDRYEVIVVDDHSTDDTPVIARVFERDGIKVIARSANGGPAAARNTAIDAAKGEIIACIDDDAVADPDWLACLIAPFKDPGLTAAGGRVFAYKTDSLAERYLSAIGSGNPTPIGFGKSKNPVWRFWAYLKSMFVPIETSVKPTPVQAVYTLNCAYRAAALRAIGGFDAALRYDEDTDVATRLRARGARIMFVPAAIVHHRHRESLRKLVRQTYRNAVNTLRYYQKEQKALPIFPLPLLYIALAVGLIILQPLAGIAFIVIGPLLLYSWWPVRALRGGNLEYSAFGYVQLAVESATIAGLLRAAIIT